MEENKYSIRAGIKCGMGPYTSEWGGYFRIMERLARQRSLCRSLPGKLKEAGVTRKLWSELLEWW